MKTTRITLLFLAAFVSAQSFGGNSRVEDVEFESRGATLSGSIMFPADQSIHAALVYDKRGAGKSGGEYEGEQNVSEKNIALLADDASAALQKLASHPSVTGKLVGFAGISQAGWIAPVAAERSQLAKFLILWSGPVSKVREEDIYSKYTADRDSLTAPPTYEEALRARKEKYVWPDFLGLDTDSGETLKKLSIPGLWLFSDNDGSILVALSIERLQALRSDGHCYDYALFSGLGHDNIDGTFAMAVYWIKRLPAAAELQAQRSMTSPARTH